MSIPEPIAAKYHKSVEVASWTIVKAWPGVFDLDEIMTEAWDIAVERWPVWQYGRNPEGYAITDLGFKLRNRAKALLRERGWKLTRIDGQQRWTPPEGGEVLIDPELFAEWKALQTVMGVRPYEPVSDTWQILDWEPMTRRQAIRFGRILMDTYPALCGEFQALDREEKPSKLSHAQWSQKVEGKRAALRVKYAVEIATAHAEARGYRIPRAA